ncbi:MAG: HU family DNA-binding protein [Paracoccaceae bacterium]
MKLDEIVTQLATEAKLPTAVARRFANKLFEGIRAAVESGEKVNVKGLGTFSMTERAEGERVGKDGTPKAVKAARYVTLKPSRAAQGKPKRVKTDTPAA